MRVYEATELSYKNGYKDGKDNAVVHAEWKYYRKQNIAVCTNCSFERDLDANFGKAVCCPNCGAMMDKE